MGSWGLLSPQNQSLTFPFGQSINSNFEYNTETCIPPHRWILSYEWADRGDLVWCGGSVGSLGLRLGIIFHTADGMPCMSPCVPQPWWTSTASSSWSTPTRCPPCWPAPGRGTSNPLAASQGRGLRKRDPRPELPLIDHLTVYLAENHHWPNNWQNHEENEAKKSLDLQRLLHLKPEIKECSKKCKMDFCAEFGMKVGRLRAERVCSPTESK